MDCCPEKSSDAAQSLKRDEQGDSKAENIYRELTGDSIGKPSGFRNGYVRAQRQQLSGEPK